MRANSQILRLEKASQSSIFSGRTFLLTRTAEGNFEERRKLESYGAKVVELPTIKISPPLSWKKLDNALLRLRDFDWIVFTSSNGVKIFFERLGRKNGKLLSDLRAAENRSPKFACVGPSTKRTLEGFGLKCSLQPNEYLTSSLGTILVSSHLEGKRCLLARAETANRGIVRILRRAGAIVSEVPVYRTVVLRRKSSMKSLEGITDITLTSPSTVEGLVGSTKLNRIHENNILVHCIGPITAKHAREKGLRIESVARVHTIEGLIDTIVKKQKSRYKTEDR